MNNSYQILKIQCDKYGFPLAGITDEQIQNAYIKRLKELFISIHPKAQLNREQLIEQGRKSEEFLTQKLEGKDNETKIKLMELMMENNDYTTNRPRIVESYNYLKEAYSSVETEPKREQYDKYLDQITNRDILEAIEEYNIPMERQQVETDTISYGDLALKNSNISTLYLSENLRMFIEKEFECKKITESEKLSNIKSMGTISESAIYRCSLIIRKNENDNDWMSREFYLEGDTIGKLRIPEENTVNKEAIQKRKEEIVKGIMTSLKDSIENRTSYIGNIVSTKDGIVCKYNKKMQERVDELEKRRNRQKDPEGPTLYKGVDR